MTPPLFQGFAASALLLAWACANSAQAQSISSGNRHVLALSKEGSVLAWGDSRDGQLGLGAHLAATTPITVPIAAHMVRVSASHTSVQALDSEGNLWSWGRNATGELGDGSLTDRREPRTVLRNITYLPANFQSIPMAVDSQGKVWSWRTSANPDPATPAVNMEYPVRIAKAFRVGSITLAIDEAGGLWGAGRVGACRYPDPQQSAQSGPVRIEGLPPIRDVKMGTVVLDYVSYTQSATVVDTQGFSWSLGKGTECRPRKGPAITPFDKNYALTQAGGVLSQYDIDSDAPTPITPPLLAKLPPVRNLSSNQTHGYALTTAGDLWQWLRAAEAQADDGSGRVLTRLASGVTDLSAFGADATQAQGVMYTTADGQLHAMGSRFDLQLGLAAETSPRSSPVAVPGLPVIASIHADGNASFALGRDGTLYGWGNAQPGLYASSPRPMAFPVPLRTVAISGGTILGIGTDGTAWHSGNRWTSGNTVSSRDPSRLVLGDAARTARALPLSADNALIVDTEGGIWGLGTFSTAAGPVTHEAPAPVPGLSPVQQVVSLGSAAVALDGSGTVWAWGIDPSVALWDASSATQYTAPKPILTGKTATAIHGGNGHFCAVLVDGSAQCHGSQLGGTTGKVFRLHAAIKEAALSKGGPSQQPGNMHFRLADGTVWAYGTGHKGQLGVGTYGSVLEPTPVNNPAGTADLDLDPDTPTAAPPATRPPFRIQTTYSGGLGQLTLSGAVFGAPTQASAPDGKYNVYVVAIASDGPGGPPTTWFQRDGQGLWSLVQWPMPAYAAKADLGTASVSVPLDIFRNFPAQGLQNSRVYVGYGIDAYEMLDAGRLREVLVMADD